MVAPIAEALVWASASFGVWLLTLSSISWAELAIAAPSSMVCGAAAVGARRSLARQWRAPSSGLSWLLPLPAIILSDTAKVLALPWQQIFRHTKREGRIVRVTAANADGPGRATTRAVAEFMISMSPGSVVLDSDESGEVVVHSLVEGRLAMEKVVQK